MSYLALCNLAYILLVLPCGVLCDVGLLMSPISRVTGSADQKLGGCPPNFQSALPVGSRRHEYLRIMIATSVYGDILCIAMLTPRMILWTVMVISCMVMVSDAHQ